MNRIELSRYAKGPDGSLHHEVTIFVNVDESHPRARTVTGFEGKWALAAVTHPLTVADVYKDMSSKGPDDPVWSGPVGEPLRPGLVGITKEQYEQGLADKAHARKLREQQEYEKSLCETNELKQKLRNSGFTEAEAARLLR